MVIERLTLTEVRRQVMSALKFAQGDLEDIAVLAEIVRRTASFECPCSSTVLRDRILRCYVGISGLQDLSERVETVIESLTVAGDLLELPSRQRESARTELFLAQPSFVRRASDSIMLFGIAPDGCPFLPENLGARIKREAHIRFIVPEAGEELPSVLTQSGLQELPRALWFRSPRNETVAGLLGRYNDKLIASGTPGKVEGLQVLDSSRSVRYYNGRWTTPHSLTGKYICRRPQRFGAPIWSYAELEEGILLRLLDIPAGEWRACDYAWWLQAAIDAARNNPQEFTVASHNDRKSLRVSFFSPLPKWIQSRWEYIGVNAKAPGSLFSYIIPKEEYEEERSVLVTHCWLREIRVKDTGEKYA